MKYHLPTTKPNDIGYIGRLEVFGLNFGLIPGWHVAYWWELKKGWYHHSACRVSCVTMWREIADPNDK